MTSLKKNSIKMTIEMAFIISEKKVITERKIYRKKKDSVIMAQASDKWKEKMKKIYLLQIKCY